MSHLDVPKPNRKTYGAPVQNDSERSQSSVNSKHSNLSALSSRQKVPVYMKSKLQQQQSSRHTYMQQNKTDKEKIASDTKLGRYLNKVVQDKQHLIMCEICSGLIKRTQEERDLIYLANCKHKEKYCQSCLHHYTIHKVNNFQQVFCPSQDCPVVIDDKGQFFRNLPAQIQRKYKMIKNFHETHKDNPNVKLCPFQSCGGTIKAAGVDKELICSKCHNLFCIQCLMLAHTGDCQQQQQKAFMKNVHYRQCPQCKEVVDAYKGSNKMVCKCGYQRCYVCGSPWSNSHYNQHDQNGDLRATAMRETVVAGGNLQNGCSDIFCYNKGGTTCGLICKIPLKLLIALFYSLVMMIIFLIRDVMIILIVSIAGLIAGMFGFSFVVLCGYRGVKFVLGALFFPAIMVIGVVKGFQDYFAPIIVQTLAEFKESYVSGLRYWCRF